MFIIIIKTIFITLIWKSVKIHANYLPLIGTIKSRIATFFALNRIFSPANEKALRNHNN